MVVVVVYWRHGALLASHSTGCTVQVVVWRGGGGTMRDHSVSASLAAGASPVSAPE